jgi:hypothetical protein
VGVKVLLFSFGERVVWRQVLQKRVTEWEVVWKGLGLVHKRAQREVAAAPSPAGKELGRWRQARATGL